jgi:hypothetical protein
LVAAAGVWRCPLPFHQCGDVEAGVKVHDWNQALRDCQHPKLTLTTKGMGWLLSTYADSQDGTRVFPARSTVAEAANLSRASKVDPHLRRLLDLGWLRRVGARQLDVAEYRLVRACTRPEKGQTCPHKGQPLPQKGPLTK